MSYKMRQANVRKRKGPGLCLVCGILAAGMMVGLAGCGQAGDGAGDGGTGNGQEGSALTGEAGQTAGIGIHHARITVEDYGDITVELDGDTAPITVENFMNLAEEGFYDGLTFHRIIDGFMIQGGDPAQNGGTQAADAIVGEFTDNGYENNISHKDGVISMARTNDPNSASSQFFITVADATYLDGQYAAFGYVTEGLDVAKQIAKDAEPVDDNGTIPYEAQPVIETISVLD